MKKIIMLITIFVSSVFIFSGCYNQSVLDTQGAINLVQDDMTNISATIRGLDNIYLEDYAINELSPLVNYNSYNNMNYTDNKTNNTTAVVNASPYNSFALTYSYSPKYIENVNSLDTSYLVSYIQSMQDLFLIISDITAANQLLNQLTYSVINDTINVRNNAYMLNYNMNELTPEQLSVLQEYSVNINNMLINIANTNGYVTQEISNLYTLRENFYRNTETLNAKYLNILNILETRITQLQNIQLILNRLNNQLLLMCDVNLYGNNQGNNINQGITNNELLNNDIPNNTYNKNNENFGILDNSTLNNNPNNESINNGLEYENLETNTNNDNISGNNNRSIDNTITNGTNTENENQTNMNKPLLNGTYNNNINNEQNDNRHICKKCPICGNCINCDKNEQCPNCSKNLIDNNNMYNSNNISTNNPNNTVLNDTPNKQAEVPNDSIYPNNNNTVINENSNIQSNENINTLTNDGNDTFQNKKNIMNENNTFNSYKGNNAELPFENINSNYEPYDIYKNYNNA